MRWLLVIALAGCNHGNHYDDDFPEGDLAIVSSDMTAAPDLAQAGKSCGEIAMCAFTCGQDIACIGMCAQGADPQQLAALGGLLLCAGQNCISFNADGGGLGGIDMTQLFMCLLQNCGSQIGMCGGLFGGF